MVNRQKERFPNSNFVVLAAAAFSVNLFSSTNFPTTFSLSLVSLSANEEAEEELLRVPRDDDDSDEEDFEDFEELKVEEFVKIKQFFDDQKKKKGVFETKRGGDF